jgi:hypothetical protein
MTDRVSRQARTGASLAACLAALLVVLAIGAGTADATGNNWGGRMPAKTWSTNGDFHSNLHFMMIEAGGPGPLCVGPAQLSGGKWSFPYGWGCQGGYQYIREFPEIGAYPAVDNPNSQPVSFGVLYF